MTTFLKRFGTRMRSVYLDLRISTKITLLYLVLILFSISMSSMVYQRIYADITAQKVGDLSMQTLYSIQSNLNSLLDNINQNSKMLLSSKDMQNALYRSESGDHFNAQIQITNYLNTTISLMSGISSVFVFDLKGKRYSMDNLSLHTTSMGSLQEAPWYKDVIARNGGYALSLNSDGFYRLDQSANFMSLIRVVNGLETQKPIGILMINIPDVEFVNCYKDIVAKYGTRIQLLDAQDNPIVYGSNFLTPDIQESLMPSLETQGYGSVSKWENGHVSLISGLRMPKTGWKIISASPFSEVSQESKAFNLVAIAVILINGVLVFIGALFISRLITTPIKKLLKAMKRVQNGQFEPVDIRVGHDEIGGLQEGFNRMISEIDLLIRRVIEEQKVKRKAELSVLQEQIKPHFLYNTLDAMSYLALSGKTQEVYEALEALGGYYRTSLSKGSESITLKEEIAIVTDYLHLQKLRYGDIFDVAYEVDERLLGYRVPKLILQPIVENALYHGIKPKGESGVITVGARQEADRLVLWVSDDGVGMDEGKLSCVMHAEIGHNATSFGLRGTVERLRMIYGIADVYAIESREREGTRVVFSLPLYMEGNNG